MSETDVELRWQRPGNDVWFLARSSWPFHRSVWRAIGRCLEYGEYTGMVRQIRWGEAELVRFGDQGALYRVALRDGRLIQIVVKAWPCKRPGSRVPNYDLLRVLHPARTKPSARKEKPPAPPVPEPPPCPSIASEPPPEPPVAAAPSPPPAPPAPVLRASTLTLGSKATSAAELLADRLRPTPLPPRAAIPIVPKKKQTRR